MLNSRTALTGGPNRTAAVALMDENAIDQDEALTIGALVDAFGPEAVASMAHRYSDLRGSRYEPRENGARAPQTQPQGQGLASPQQQGQPGPSGQAQGAPQQQGAPAAPAARPTAPAPATPTSTGDVASAALKLREDYAAWHASQPMASGVKERCRWAFGHIKELAESPPDEYKPAVVALAAYSACAQTLSTATDAIAVGVAISMCTPLWPIMNGVIGQDLGYTWRVMGVALPIPRPDSARALSLAFLHALISTFADTSPGLEGQETAIIDKMALNGCAPTLSTIVQRDLVDITGNPFSTKDFEEYRGLIAAINVAMPMQAGSAMLQPAFIYARAKMYGACWTPTAWRRTLGDDDSTELAQGRLSLATSIASMNAMIGNVGAIDMSAMPSTRPQQPSPFGDEPPELPQGGSGGGGGGFPQLPGFPGFPALPGGGGGGAPALPGSGAPPALPAAPALPMLPASMEPVIDTNGTGGIPNFAGF